MYNLQFKYDLCRYWQKLEESGFDPVMGKYKIYTNRIFYTIYDYYFKNI